MTQISQEARELLARQLDIGLYHDDAERIRTTTDGLGEVCAASALSAIQEVLDERDALKSQKWDVKHTDAMNDMVAMGLARDAAEANVLRLTSQLEQAQGAVTRLEADRNDWHDSYQKLAVRFEEQGVQLEQAEKVVKPFADFADSLYASEGDDAI